MVRLNLQLNLNIRNNGHLVRTVLKVTMVPVYGGLLSDGSLWSGWRDPLYMMAMASFHVVGYNVVVGLSF